jgi:hypothetical protein
MQQVHKLHAFFGIIIFIAIVNLYAYQPMYLTFHVKQDAEECWTQILYTLSQSLRSSGSR